jgi:hypothetical protein
LQLLSLQVNTINQLHPTSNSLRPALLNLHPLQMTLLTLIQPLRLSVPLPVPGRSCALLTMPYLLANSLLDVLFLGVHQQKTQV